MKNYLLTLALVLVASISLSAAERKYEVTSPDGTLKADVVIGETVSYSVQKMIRRFLIPLWFR